MKWHRLPSSALSEKAPIKLLKIAGRKVCLISNEGKWHATSARCPHAGANLAGGWCENGQLFCPYHRHHFDLLDGKGAPGQNNSIIIYLIEEREDGLYIQLPETLMSKWLAFLT